MADASVVRVFLTAVQFLTRVPVPGGQAPASVETLGRAVKFFPLVGALIGLFTAGAVALGAHLWPVWLAVILALAFEAYLTGAFHEDAVADFFDAFGGAWDREGILRILKDSRIGSYGTVAIGLLLALRAACMIAAPANARIAAIIAAATLGRLAILPVMALVPPVEHREGLAKDVGRRVDARGVLAGLALAVPGLAWWAYLAPVHCACAVAILVAIVAYFRHLLLRRIHGVTGDCLGAVCYLTQVATLLVASAQ